MILRIFLLQFKDPIYGSSDPSFTDFVAPGVILTIVFFLAVALTSSALIIERMEGLLDRSWVAGTVSGVNNPRGNGGPREGWKGVACVGGSRCRGRFGSGSGRLPAAPGSVGGGRCGDAVPYLRKCRAECASRAREGLEAQGSSSPGNELQDGGPGRGNSSEKRSAVGGRGGGGGGTSARPGTRDMKRDPVAQRVLEVATNS